VALVEGLETEEVGRDARGGGGALGLPGEGRRVVRERVDGALTAVHLVDKDVVVRDGPGELEIRIGERAVGVAAADDGVLDVEGERCAPEDRVEPPGVMVSDEENPAHAGGCGVGGTDGCNRGVDDLSEASRPGVEIGDDPTDVVEKVVHVRGNADALPFFVAKRLLEEAEEPPEAGDGEDHAAELAEELLPSFGSDAGLGFRELIEDGLEAKEPSRRQFDGVTNAVHHPAQDGLAGAPSTVPLEELLDRDGFLARVGIVGRERTKNQVDGLEQNAPDPVLARRATLD
jgi:hypothetical protein